MPQRRSPFDEDELLTMLVVFDDLSRYAGPTIREFQTVLGLSSTSVADYRLRRLAREGWVTQLDGGVSRGWLLTDAGRVAVESCEQTAAS